MHCYVYVRPGRRGGRQFGREYAHRMTTGTLPEGFAYHPDFLTAEEHDRLLAFCREQDLAPFVYNGRPSNRRVKNFGVNFDYDRKVTFLDGPVPPESDWLLDRVASTIGLPSDRLSELLITQYPPGAGINWHRDSRPFETVVGISLGADSALQLRPVVKSGERSPITKLIAEARSMYVLDGPARTQWMHRVPPVDAERYSITIRSIRPGWEASA